MFRLTAVVLLVSLPFSPALLADCTKNPANSTFRVETTCDYTKPCLEDQPQTLTLRVDTGCYPWWVPCQPFDFASCDTVVWDFGDGKTATVTGSPSVSHVWSEPGQYTVNVRISNPHGETTTGTTFTSVRNPPAYVHWADDLYTAHETDPDVTMTLVREGDLSRDVTVLLGVVGSSVQEPWLFTLESVWDRPITIPAGKSSIPVTLKIRNDDVYRGELNYQVFVYDWTGQALLPTGSYIHNTFVRMIDDEPGPVLSFEDVRVTEGDGRQVIHVPLVLSEPLAQDLLIFWDVVASTATRGSDWDVTDNAGYFVPQTLRAGQTHAQIDIAILGDRQAEGEESLEIKPTLSGPPVALSAPTFRVTIVDDDLYQMNPIESTGDVGKSVSLTVARATSSPTAAIVQLLSSDTSIVAPPASITIPGGALQASFDVLLARPGIAQITATFPDGKLTSAEVRAIQRASVSFDATDLRVAVGEKRLIQLKTTPALATVASLEARPAGIVDVPATLVIGASGTASFEIEPRKSGSADIIARLPSELTGAAGLITIIAVEELTPHITEIEPPFGNTAGSTLVRIHANDLGANCGVSFGGMVAETTRIDEKTLSAKAPAHAPGMVDVAVTCGSASATSANAFRYVTPRRRSVR